MGRRDVGAGAQLLLAASGDERFPPENILDGNTETFWMTTGMFPQEFVISFPNLVQISNVKIHCFNVCSLSIETSVAKDPVDFELLCEKELLRSEDRLQVQEFEQKETSAMHLRFVIHSGFDHFVSVHKVSVEGEETGD